MSTTEFTFWCIYIGGMVGALFRPLLGVCLYILVYNLNPETQWWGGNFQDVRTSMTVAAATGIGLVLNWRSMRSDEQQFPWMFRFMLLFMLYCVGSAILGNHLHYEQTRFLLDKLARICVFVFMMVRVVRHPSDLRWMLWTWMAGTIYIGYQAWSGVGRKMSGRLSTGLGGPDFSDSSGLAAHLVAMLAIAGFLFYSSNTRRGQFFALLAGAYSVNTIILTRTRNAFPGVLVMIFFGLLRLPKGMRLKCAAGMAIGLVLAVQLTDEGWWHRMETLKRPEEDASIVNRLTYWHAAVDMANQHPFGVGPGKFRVTVFNYVEDLSIGRSAHSSYMECLAELGYPGLLLFLLIMISALLHCERTRAFCKSWPDDLGHDPERAAIKRNLLLMATANEVAMAGFMVCSAFTTRLWTEGQWLLLAMSCCVRNVCINIQAQQARDAAPATPEAKPQAEWLRAEVSHA